MTRNARPQRVRPEKISRGDSAEPVGHSAKRKGRIVATIAGTAVLVVAVGLVVAILTDGFRVTLGSGSTQPAAPPSFVGSEACASCHQGEARLWRASQHAHAMDHASEKTVLGDFSNTSFDHNGVHSRFFRDGGKFMVETDGPDGKLAPFEVKYTFGVDPLQQYLIEFPDGRIQALSIAWDTRPKEAGGQRWFHLYPNESIGHDDVLHWTRLNQNWNFMCAECHSTGVAKNYDAANDTFATRFAEISVGCEACHGQGSRHVAWARAQQGWWPFSKPYDAAKGLLVAFDERAGITWLPDPRTGKPQRRIAPAILRKEVETCGLCHARRAAFAEDWVPGRWLSDTHFVAPLARALYFADGQMQDEVYNYGSFKQSRMFAAGVTCSDCHEPHTGKLRADGNNVCLQCHSAATYAAASHHHHEAVSPPVACASCHMPTRTYMVVDARHDHSFRVPRPDESIKLGTPNACNACHGDKSAQWAAAAIEAWHGGAREGFQTYGPAFHAAWTAEPNAAALLSAVAADGNTPAFARAGALTELASYLSPANVKLAQGGLADPDPMVRIGALDMLAGAPASRLWPLMSPLLADPVRGVRLRAVELIAEFPTARMAPADRERFERAVGEFVAAQRVNADRPEARTTLANFYVRLGRDSEAETEYRAALKLDAQFAPAALHLAELDRLRGRDADAEHVLRTAIAASPGDAGLHHALGLALARLDRRAEALEELRRAAELDPDRARYAFVYAVGLHDGGRIEDAMALLKASLARHPNDRDILMALVSYSREAGDPAGALGYAEQAARIAPGDPNLAALIGQLRQQVGK
jgi:predicted CXXCH cytochrome family protein